MSAVLAIVGRPNVGKSTLFNRLTGRRAAIVHDMPGVTRDRREGHGRLADLSFTVVDTAGFEDTTDDSMRGRMRRQTEMAISEADVALLLVDGRAGVTPLDEAFAALLRKSPVPVVLVVNKAEGRAAEAGYLEAYALGLGEPVAISAEHGEGLGNLYDALLPHLEPETPDAPEDDTEEDTDDEADDLTADPGFDPDAELDEAKLAEKPLQMAIVGRPNVGKSTLINRLLGQDRLLTGPEPGVTRDAITVPWQYGERRFKLVDTAGMRRKARIEDAVEKLSVADTLHTIRMSEVVLLLLDANMVLEKQELTIARMVIDEGRALIIGVNKWDIAENRDEALQRLRDRLETSLPQVRGIPFVTVSAQTGKNLDKLMDEVIYIHKVWNARARTADLNGWLKEMTTRHPPPLSSQKRRINLKYITQIKSRPPTFALFTTRPEDLPESYMRYLVNGLREDFGLMGVPIRLYLRKPDNPYADKARK